MFGKAKVSFYGGTYTTEMYIIYKNRREKAYLFRELLRRRNKNKKINYYWFTRSYIIRSRSVFELIMLPFALYRYSKNIKLLRERGSHE